MKLSLPKLSATMEEGTIGTWMKQVGDTIREGEALYEVETDKAAMEVESPVSGILIEILTATGQTVAVGAEVCVIRTEATAAAAGPGPGLLRASPSARRLARELGVDIRTLAGSGSGPAGRIRNRDIAATTNAAANAAAEKDNALQPLQVERRDAEPAAPRLAVSAMRRTIARELVRSTQTIPMFWVEKWVNAGQLLKWKDLLKHSRDSASSLLTVTDFVLQAIGLALGEMPEINRRWVTDAAGMAAVEPIGGSHVGLAVSVAGGVIAPTIADVDAISLLELARRRNDLAEAVRAGRLSSSREPAAITLSNLGNTGIDRFRAIIKPDEAMIVTLGALREKVVAEQGNVVVQQGFSMVLSADHRLIDGADAARFLGRIARIIEEGSWRIA